MKATLVIQNIQNLITVEGKNKPRAGSLQGKIGLIEDGILAVNNDNIIYVGQGELPKTIEIDDNTIIIDGTGKTITPGLIDSHTHLVHGGSREYELSMKLNGKGYLDILKAGGGIHSTARATTNASFKKLYEKSEKSLNTMLEFGVTSVEAKSGYGIGNFDTEIKQLEVVNQLNENHTIDIISTFMGAHAVPKEYKHDSDAFVDILVDDMIPEVANRKLAKFCDVFCEEGVFSVEQSRKILNVAKKYGLLTKIHADEIVSLGGAELAAEIGCISAEHLIGASDQGIKSMAENGVIAVLLPGTSFYLQNGTVARARKMIKENVPIAISTDYNPGSCPSENLQLMMTLAALTLKMTPEEIIVGTTMNAACALGIQDKVGSLEVGKKADIAIFDTPNLEYLIYHFGINHTYMVIKNGEIVYRSKNI